MILDCAGSIFSPLTVLLDDINTINDLLQQERPEALDNAERTMLRHDRDVRRLWVAWNLGDQEEPWIHLEVEFGVTEDQARIIEPAPAAFFFRALQGAQPEAASWRMMRDMTETFLKRIQPKRIPPAA